MTDRRNARLDADHTPIPQQGERGKPVICNTCKTPLRSTWLVGDPRTAGNEKWFHGTPKSTMPMSHPDATVVFDSGWVRHYPHPKHPHTTLCLRYYEGKGRKYRFGDCPHSPLCTRCKQLVGGK